MKIFITWLLTLVLLPALKAQTKDGVILFETKTDMHRRIPADNQQALAVIPKTRVSKNELLFSSSQTLYRPEEEEPDLTQPEGGGMMIKLKGPGDNIYYQDFSVQKTIEVRELMGNNYVIEQPMDSGKLNWKLVEGETKTILGHLCHKATAKTARGFDIEAWYADDIPLSSGPQGIRGLPGLVLMTDMNKSEFVTTAVEFRNTFKKSELKAPGNGKKVTEAEFAKIVKDAFGDQNGGVRIVTNDN